MLLADDQTLPRFVETDRLMKHRDKEGNPTSYSELLEKADARLAAITTPEQMAVLAAVIVRRRLGARA